MRKLIIPALLCLAACNNSEETKTEVVTDTVATTTPEPMTSNALDSNCYILTEGKGNVDTMAMKLFTEGNEAWGKLMYLYHEKDWRMGRFHGTRSGDVVNAKWVYLQEGMQDSVDISFKLQSNSAFQKNLHYDKATGKDVLIDSAAYGREFKRIDCSQFPKYDFDFGL
ncbi:MAG: hypothetical protein EOP56_09100 [Sphingobacteriales bacterium]|nr:MAG: hypothetical protein EOP56_09100 [Sphingobacteriales bacterium]